VDDVKAAATAAAAAVQLLLSYHSLSLSTTVGGGR
jgi:hypothetical protein